MNFDNNERAGAAFLLFFTIFTICYRIIISTIEQRAEQIDFVIFVVLSEMYDAVFHCIHGLITISK